jgi:nucleoside-triphosphatase THEP1
VVGVPGTGKTTYATAIAEDMSKRAYVIAHSGGTLPEAYPNGKRPKVKQYASIAELSKGLSRDPRGIHLVDAEPTEVIGYAEHLAATSLEANGGTHGVPVLLFIDEVVAVDEVSPYRLNETMGKIVALRRHKNVGVLFTTQSPQLCHYQMFALATEVTFFRIIHEDAIKRFRKIGVPKAIMERVPSLSRERHEYIRWRDG